MLPRIFRGFALSVALGFMGTSVFALPYGGEVPAFEGQPVLALKRYEPSSMQMPVGGYLVPNSAIVLLRGNAQDNALFFGALFGPLGTLAANSAGAEAGKAAAGENPFRTDMPETLGKLIDTQYPELAGYMQPRGSSATGMRLVLEPKAFLRIAADGLTSVSVQLDVDLLGPTGDEKWKGRYSFTPPAQLKLTGADGWLSNQNAPLREAVVSALTAQLDALSLDLKRQPYPDNAAAADCKLPPNMTFVGVIQGKGVVAHFFNKRAGSFTVFFDPSPCKRG
jgi:hypothetical protein